MVVPQKLIGVQGQLPIYVYASLWLGGNNSYNCLQKILMALKNVGTPKYCSLQALLEKHAVDTW